MGAGCQTEKVRNSCFASSTPLLIAESTYAAAGFFESKGAAVIAISNVKVRLRFRIIILNSYAIAARTHTMADGLYCSAKAFTPIGNRIDLKTEKHNTRRIRVRINKRIGIIMAHGGPRGTAMRRVGGRRSGSGKCRLPCAGLGVRLAGVRLGALCYSIFFAERIICFVSRLTRLGISGYMEQTPAAAAAMPSASPAVNPKSFIFSPP